MILREKLLDCLKDSPKTNNELKKVIPTKNMRIISATISQNKKYFLRLDKAWVGLVGRDEHLITGNRIVADKFCLYKKLYNLLINQEKRLEEIYLALPKEKQVSIRATVNMRPDLFVRVAIGVIGKRGRDDHLIERYRIAKESTKFRIPQRKTIADRISLILLDGTQHITKIRAQIPNHCKDAISSQLSKHNKFVKLGNGYWKLK